MGKICTHCKLEKPESEFGKQKTGKGGLRAICRKCANEQRRLWYKAHKEEADKNNLERKLHKKELANRLKTPCVKCGEQRNYVIQFHHINPDTKLFSVGAQYFNVPEVKLREEINKCVCLCANCHFEFHYLYGNEPEKPIEALKEYLGEEVFNE